MEDLNKSQLILLTILVSFVTSIATGIVTVSLMQEAPPVVTQTINRIVERTIEKVVPGETKIETVVKETPVIVTEEEMIVEIVKAASGGLVRISRGEEALGSGFLVSRDGLILTSEDMLNFEGALDLAYKITFYNGKTAKARLVKKGEPKGFALLKLDLGVASDMSQVPEFEDKERPLAILSLHDSDVFPGQTVVALGFSNAGTVNVFRGIIAGFGPTDTSTSGIIETSAAQAVNIGGPLLNLKGRVIGLNSKEGAALNVQPVRELLAK